MASGVSELPLDTAVPTVKTRAKVPMPSTMYFAPAPTLGVSGARWWGRCVVWVPLPVRAPEVKVAMRPYSRWHAPMSLPPTRVRRGSQPQCAIPA